jgi:hypothetical protein
MRKFTKLVLNPRLFLVDAVSRRVARVGDVGTRAPTAYTSNTGNDTHLVRHTDLTHLVLGDGGGDEAGSSSRET